jgi:NTP pyrophosphatase (non-canonical NTP hydrolase)
MSENMWGKMWVRQQKQQEAFNLDPRAMAEVDRARVAKDLALGLYEEVGELVADVARYKAHILRLRPVETINVADEAADVLKYLISIAQLYGVTDVELFEAFMRKSDVVDDRANGERLTLERKTQLVIIDLDNVVADLSGWSAKLGEARGGAPMNDRTVNLLESLKTDFYRDGGFRDIPAIAGAPEGTRLLREAGYKIVIITARPYWQYKRIYADTLHWLQKHDVAYDLILYNKDKAEAIYEHIFPARPVCFIEDRDKHALEVAGIGVPVLLLDWPHNHHLSDSSLITRVYGWGDIVRQLTDVTDMGVTKEPGHE